MRWGGDRLACSGQRTSPARSRVAVGVVAILLMAACQAAPAASRDPNEVSGTIRLYTSVTQDTVDAVLAAFADAHPEVAVETFRAPTGEVDARIAAERRAGRIGADVLWGSDPLSVQAYAADDLLQEWAPNEADAVPPAYRSDTFWGTRILNMVIVAAADLDPAPEDWSDLADPAFADSVALADPGFAGSAFGALGYFATAPEYGWAYYRDLEANGAIQVQSVPQVLTDVAEGAYAAGMTLDKIARDAIAQGSPVQLVWPASGAIAIYSPIAVFTDAANTPAARAFVDFVLGTAAQAAIAETGWQPIRSDVSGGPPIDGPQVAPDWAVVFSQQDELLREYRSIFGG